MNSQQALDIGTGALVVCAKVAGPFLIVVLAIGIVVGLLQSITQLQEPTLTFVPKLVGSAIVIAVGGNWMLATLVSYGHELIAGVPALLNG
ncbi:MAG: Flagellar biosynthesis protein FliQ [Ilumatobacteraceae bacterium]|nr:Flagellar biosynthesis protein FliQ [Ilumatobacteraceae bacterium]